MLIFLMFMPGGCTAKMNQNYGLTILAENIQQNETIKPDFMFLLTDQQIYPLRVNVWFFRLQVPQMTCWNC